MKKINETYQHEHTGIIFDIEYKDEVSPMGLHETIKKVRVDSSKNAYRNSSGFVFNRSTPRTLMAIGKALLEIGEFCEKL